MKTRLEGGQSCPGSPLGTAAAFPGFKNCGTLANPHEVRSKSSCQLVTCRLQLLARDTSSQQAVQNFCQASACSLPASGTRQTARRCASRDSCGMELRLLEYGGAQDFARGLGAGAPTGGAELRRHAAHPTAGRLAGSRNRCAHPLWPEQFHGPGVGRRRGRSAGLQSPSTGCQPMGGRGQGGGRALPGAGRQASRRLLPVAHRADRL